MTLSQLLQRSTLCLGILTGAAACTSQQEPEQQRTEAAAVFAMAAQSPTMKALAEAMDTINAGTKLITQEQVAGLIKSEPWGNPPEGGAVLVTLPRHLTVALDDRLRRLWSENPKVSQPAERELEQIMGGNRTPVIYPLRGGILIIPHKTMEEFTTAHGPNSINWAAVARNLRNMAPDHIDLLIGKLDPTKPIVLRCMNLNMSKCGSVSDVQQRAGGVGFQLRR